MALAMTGRVADGLILQLADPDLIRWFVGQVREAAAAAGRDPAAIRVQAAAPAHVGDLALGRERTRWFPALVSNHVVDLVNKYPREQLPEALTGYIRTGRATTTTTTPRSARRTRRSSATRSRTGSASSARSTTTSRSCASWRRPASTSSTCT